MNVGILLGDFQLQRRLTGLVVSQRAEKIRSIQERFPPRRFGIFRRGELVKGIEREGDVIDSVDLHPQSIGEADARLIALLLGIAEL